MRSVPWSGRRCAWYTLDAMETALEPGAVTALLRQWHFGNPEALGRVLPLVYEELRAIARAYMSKERSGHTLSVTSLVHEVFLRLTGQPPESWRDRKHFYGIAARLMRQVLVDYARYHRARKREAAAGTIGLDLAIEAPWFTEADYLTLDVCLSRLEKVNPRRAGIVELRFFAGLTIPEIAESQDLSPSMVKKELTIAKVWLYRQMQGGDDELRLQPES